MKGKDSYQFPLAKMPAIRTAILFLAGIIMCRYAGTNSILIPLIFFLILFLGITAEIFLKIHYTGNRYFLALFFYLLLLISAGAVRLSLSDYLTGKEKAEISKLLLFEGDHLTVKGRILERGITGTGRISLIAVIEETVIGNRARWRKKYRIQLYSDKNRDSERLLPGVITEAVIRLFPKSERRNPHDFDYSEWLERKSIYLQGTVEKIVDYRETPGENVWMQIRNSVFKAINRQYPGDVQPIAKALLTGEKGDLSSDEKAAFSRSGLSHIMAVSGLHVGFIAAPFWIFIPYFWTRKSGKWIGLIIFTSILLLYAVITGFSASVSRASLMAWLLTYSRLFHKMSNSFNLMGVAALILMLINPLQVFDVGFQLSFSAVFIILLIMPLAAGIISEKYRYRMRGKLVTIVLISAVVQTGLFPVLVYYFGEFSVIGPLANALVIPLLTVAVPAGTCLLLFSAFTGMSVQPLTLPVEWVFLWIRQVAGYLAQTDVSYITISSEYITPLVFFIWAAAISFIAMIRIPQVKWKALILVLILLNLWSFSLLSKNVSGSRLRVTVLDVDQGDAIHIETPGGNHFFIDTGRWSPFSNSGDKVLVPYLKWSGIDHLNALFHSHPHSDHIGGTPSLITAVKIDSIYRSGYQYSSNLFKNITVVAQNKGIGTREIKMGEVIDIDPAVRLYVLSPDKNFHFSNPNNHSLVLKLVYGETSFLFTGDAESEQEKVIAEQYGGWLKSDFLKAGHHGSRTSSSDFFLKFVQPEYAAVSLAYRNLFSHPHKEAVQRLYSHNIKVDFTSLGGAAVFESDGRQLKRISWK